MKHKGIVVLAVLTASAGATLVASLAFGTPRRVAPRAPLELDERGRLEARLRYDPEDRQALALMADLELREGDPKAAIDPLRRLTRLDPENPRAWSALALTYERAAQPSQALAAAQRVLAKKPDDPDMTDLTIRAVMALNEKRMR